MAIKIQWVPPDNSSVGSVLIYRATDNIADSLGSRTILTTIGALSGANWVTSYTDGTGTNYSVYRIQFWDGVGSSDLSDPIQKYFSDLLANINEVKLTARLGPNADVGSDEVHAAIKDASNWIYREYGKPIKKTAILLETDDTDETYTYDFTGDLGPVYQIEEITVGNASEYPVSGSSFSTEFRKGYIQFGSAFVSAHAGELVRIVWVPQIINDMVKTKAAMDLVEMGMITDGRDVTNPRFTKLERQLKEIQDSMKPRAVYSARQVFTGDEIIDSEPSHVSTWADYIGQKINRRTLRFNNTTS